MVLARSALSRHAATMGALALLGCGGPSDDAKDRPAPPDDSGTLDTPPDSDPETEPTDTSPPVDTDTHTTPATVVTVEVSDNPRLVLEKRFLVTLDRPDGVHLECVHEVQVAEHHVLDSPVPGTVHQILLRGLLENQGYNCEITPNSSDVPWQGRVETGAIDIPMPDLRVSGTRSGAAGVYTLFNHFRYKTPRADPKVLIVDPEGRVRWYATTDPAGGGLAASYDGEHVVVGGGSGANPNTAHPPTMLDLSSTVAWAFPWGPNWNHEAVRHPNGNLVGLLYDPVDDNVVEEREVGTDAVAFRWTSADAVSRGELPPGGLHMNAVTPVTDVGGEAFYVSLKGLSLVVRVDRTTSRVNWHLGPDGDFPLLMPGGAPADPSAWFYGQHAPYVVADDPERVKIYVYDNGTERPDGTLRSRAVELELDLVQRTATLLWDYAEPGWYEPIWGSVVPLPDGNVLIGKGHCWSCVPDSTYTAIIEVDPDAGNEVAWRLDFGSHLDGLYRATRIDGCAIFANKAYCDAL